VQNHFGVEGRSDLCLSWSGELPPFRVLSGLKQRQLTGPGFHEIGLPESGYSPPTRPAASQAFALRPRPKVSGREPRFCGYIQRLLFAAFESLNSCLACPTRAAPACLDQNFQ
jgi:hypothetical protein